MDIKIQLICLAVSFLYGVFIAFVVSLNKCVKYKSKLLKVIASFVLTFDLTVLYLLIVYKINGGIFHIYFILLIIVSFLIFYKKTLVLIKCLFKRERLLKK